MHAQWEGQPLRQEWLRRPELATRPDEYENDDKWGDAQNKWIADFEHMERKRDEYRHTADRDYQGTSRRFKCTLLL